MISILCPCYNEEKSLPLFYQSVIRIMEKTGEQFEIIFVNDGSKDNTIEILKSLSESDSRLKAIDFSRNFGKEAAITAALDYSSGDAVIILDADLQQPPELIPEMLAKWREGYDVVAARRDRATDSFIKKFTALTFYRLHNAFSQIEIPANVGDFRLMSRRVVNALNSMKESQRFMKGLFAWAGFKTCFIDYKVAKRAAGESKFNLLRLWSLAIEGITSFSAFPLTMWGIIGAIIAMGAFIYGLYIFFQAIIYGLDVPGYATLLCLILLFGGLQLLGIGIIGEYLGRTYIESKNRPIYIIREIYSHEKINSEC